MPVKLWTCPITSSPTSSLLKDSKAIMILESRSCLVITTWFDINIYLRQWNLASDPFCPENIFSTWDECVGWSHIQECLKTFGMDYWNPYVLHITWSAHSWSFCESACCKATVALLWGGFIQSWAYQSACAVHIQNVIPQPSWGVSCASAEVHRDWCSEVKICPNRSW